MGRNRIRGHLRAFCLALAILLGFVFLHSSTAALIPCAQAEAPRTEAEVFPEETVPATPETEEAEEPTATPAAEAEATETPAPEITIESEPTLGKLVEGEATPEATQEVSSEATQPAPFVEASIEPKSPVSPFHVEGNVLIAYSGSERDVVVPDELGIEEIGSHAFASNETLRSVQLPNAVRTIGEGAFLNCVALERVTLPEQLHKVGMDAFTGCPRLVALVRPNSPGLRYCLAMGIPYELLDDAPEATLPDVQSTPTPTSEILPPEPSPGETSTTLEPELTTPTPEPEETTPEPEETTPEPEETTPEPEEPTPEPEETTPEPTMGSIALENGDITIGRGENVAGALKPVLSGGAEGTVYYTSSDPKVARVDLDGKLYGITVGSAVITAALNDDVKASCTVTVAKAPKSIALKLSSKTLGAGEAAECSFSFDKDAHSYARILTSSNKKVARIEDGRVVAVGKGTATITAKAFNGKKASVKLTVRPAPEGLKFTSSDAPLGVGMTLKLAATYSNSGAAGAITCTIAEGGEFATLEDKTLTALAEGEVTITATAYNGVSASQTLQILPAPSMLTPSTENVELCVGQKLKTPIEISADTQAPLACTYVSSNPNIVSVNASGAITGKKKGAATITVTTYNGVSASYGVTVFAAPGSIKISTISSLGVGETVMPKVTTPTSGAKIGSYTLSSSNSKVIKVQSDQLVAVGKGTATITAKAFNGKKASVKLTVKPAPEGLKFTSSDAPLGVGMTLKLAVAYSNSGAAGAITCTITGGSEFASLEDKTLTALAEGEVTVTATAYNGVSTSQTLQIFPAPTALQAAQAQTLTLGVGERIHFDLEVQPENAQSSYTYTSSNSAVAKVDAKGNVSCLKAGSAEIFVTAFNGLSASMSIQVKNYNDVHPLISIAHRGASGYKRENTLDAFRYAAELGSDMIETDVRQTKDEQFVLFHDSTISSKGKKVAISSLTLEQLRKIDARIPTLDEGLDCISSFPIQLLIEFKDKGSEIEEAVVAIVEAHGMKGRVLYCSFDQDCLKRVHSMYPGARTIITIQSVKDIKKVISTPASFNYAMGFSVRYDLLTAAYVRDMHAQGFKVYAWTPNSTADIKKVAKCGVDGICTNYPDRVRPYQ